MDEKRRSDSTWTPVIVWNEYGVCVNGVPIPPDMGPKEAAEHVMARMRSDIRFKTDARADFEAALPQEKQRSL